MQLTKRVTGFRNDINGLRAWAVVAVLLFHFQVPGFTAGFFGVDIFFVISGFLMTGILLRGLESGNFSLWQFYLARVRRIVPALMLLLVVLLGLGWFWLPTADYQQLGTESAYSLGFLSNIHYWRLAGYFDSTAHQKWLLHTWSLGIEMQFYLLYPLFVLTVWKIRPGVKAFAWSLLALFVLSLGLSFAISNLKPVASFYLLPTRGWELAAGGLVYLLGRHPLLWQQHGKWLYGFGLLLWLIGLILIDAQRPWPSGWALLPVLGTVLIILAEQNRPRLMVNPLAQWLGSISYSLYLWHWPVVVALHFAGLHQEWLWVVGGLALSLLLGQLSFKLVENPTRRVLIRSSFARQVVVFSVISVLVGLAAVSVRLLELEGRPPERYALATAESTNYELSSRSECAPGDDNTSPGCVYGHAEIGAILIGDSHTQSTVTALEQAGDSFGRGTLYLGSGGCRPIIGLKSSVETSCFPYNEWLFKTELPKYAGTGLPVIYVTRLSWLFKGYNEDPNEKPSDYIEQLAATFDDPIANQRFKEAFIETSCEIASRNPLYVMRPIPEIGVHVPNTLASNIRFRNSRKDIKITLEEYHERHAFVSAMLDETIEKCGIKILDPLPYLCDAQYCYGSRNGRPLYFDDDHLSEYGNKYLVPMFEQVFR